MVVGHGRQVRADRGRLLGLCGALNVLLVLGGCVETTAQADLTRGDVRGAIAAGRMANPRSATVALASIEGPPQDLAVRLERRIVAEAATRDVTITEFRSARYVVRGYFDAYPTDDGTALSYVWDVFDAERQRTQRLEDRIALPGHAPDPWSLLDDHLLGALANRSADDLAIYLSGTPEAAGVVRVSDPATSATRSAVEDAVAGTAPMARPTPRTEKAPRS